MEEGMSYKLELLGSSQTFLGVLATIVILFIIADKSNLIHYILLEVKDKIASQVSSLKINTSIDSVLSSSNFKLLNYFLDKQNNDELEKEGTQLLAKITSERAAFQISYIFVEGNNGKILDIIKNSKEPLLAPLYTFIFCITIFIYDELLRSERIWFNDMLISSLSCFILISYLYWFVMWVSFINNINFKETKKDIELTRLKKSLSKYGCRFKKCHCKIIDYLNEKSIVWLFVLRASIYFLLLLAALFINAYWFHINSYIIILLCIILPIVLTGILRLYSYGNKGKYSYVFMCGHYIVIKIVSILLSISIFYLVDITNTAESVLIPYTSCIWIKLSIFSFVLLNGIFFPFILPYYSYNSYYKYAKDQVTESEKEATHLVKQLQDSLDSFCDKIPQPQ